MKNILLLNFIAFILLISCQQKEKKIDYIVEKASAEVVFTANDNTQIFGDLYYKNKTSPIILLFHQARANAKGEYGTIIPKLINEGFNVLAIDQRTGGQYFGDYNRTIAKSANNSYKYCDAYPDLEAALQFVIDQGFSGKKIVWGSSYSAALVIKLGHEYPEKVDGILAFSPASGKPMEGCGPNGYFDTLKTPLLVLRPKREMEIASVKVQFELAKKNNHQVYISENGVHGSSMLVENRTKSNNDATWKVVTTFLAGFKN